MVACGNVFFAVLNRVRSCLHDVCFGSWSLLLIPTEKIIILTDGLGGVFSQTLRK